MTALPDDAGLRGSSPATMIEQITDVLTPLREALESMRITAPNGRDYLDEVSLALAMSQHRLWISTLALLIADMERLQKHWARRRDER